MTLEEGFENKLNDSQYLLVDFSTDWCWTCQTMDDIIAKVKQEIGDKLEVLQIDLDKIPQLKDFYHIKHIPTFILFKNKKIIWRNSGLMTVNELSKEI